jgi:hypothetical protein
MSVLTVETQVRMVKVGYFRNTNRMVLKQNNPNVSGMLVGSWILKDGCACAQCHHETSQHFCSDVSGQIHEAVSVVLVETSSLKRRCVHSVPFVLGQKWGNLKMNRCGFEYDLLMYFWFWIALHSPHFSTTKSICVEVHPLRPETSLNFQCRHERLHHLLHEQVFQVGQGIL